MILWTDGANRRFEFDEGSQLFIRTHNETLSIARAVFVSNSRLFARWNQSRRRSPNSIRLC